MLKNDSSYGSDSGCGMVWGYRFTPGEPARPATSEMVKEFLSSEDGSSPEEFLWLHFSLSNSATEQWLRENLILPDAFYESLSADEGATRLELGTDSLVAVIHDVLYDFKFDASAIARMSVCVGRRILVSARLRPMRSVDRLRKEVRSGKGFRSPVELLAHLLQDQAEVLVDILQQSTLRVDKIEDGLLANRLSANRAELGSLRRVLVRLQRLLAPEPAALFRLLNRPTGWIAVANMHDLRQAAEEFSTVVGDTTLLVERVKLIQEELAALVNEQSNKTLYVLTVVTVLALPINLVAGLFGMNVGGIPLSGYGHGFLLIVGALILLTLILAYLAFGRRRD